MITTIRVAETTHYWVARYISEDGHKYETRAPSEREAKIQLQSIINDNQSPSSSHNQNPDHSQ